MGEQIINQSYHEVRGVDMHFGIAYGENTDAARKVIDEVLANHPHILKDPAPFVEVETLNDSSVDFLVRPFCEGAHYFNVLYSVPEQVKKRWMRTILKSLSLTARSLLLTKTHPKTFQDMPGIIHSSILSGPNS